MLVRVKRSSSRSQQWLFRGKLLSFTQKSAGNAAFFIPILVTAEL